MGIVGLVGLIGSGKGTVGEYLVNRHAFLQDSFAKPLKDAASVIFGWDRKLLEGDTAESRAFRDQIDQYWTKALGREFTPRIALQLLGTEAGRNVFSENLWTASLIHRLNRRRDYVITDVRFPNEIVALKKAGALIIRIQRGENPWWYDLALEINRRVQMSPNPLIPSHTHDTNLPHISEWAWVGHPGIDVTITNNGTREEMITEFMNHIHFDINK